MKYGFLTTFKIVPPNILPAPKMLLKRSKKTFKPKIKILFTKKIMKIGLKNLLIKGKLIRRLKTAKP
jgi:hypothetical protein